MYTRPKQQRNLNGYKTNAYKSQVEPWHPLSYYLTSQGADVDGVTQGNINRRYDDPEDADAGIIDKTCSFKEDSFSMIDELGKKQAEIIESANEK